MTEAANVAIRKLPDNQVVGLGKQVDLTIVVTNTGTLPLANVNVTDANVPACDFAIGTLPAGEHRSKTCSAMDVTVSFTNTAIVTGTVQGAPDSVVEDSDDAVVIVAEYRLYLPLVTKNSE